MELSSSLPPDLLSLVDPSARGAASPLASTVGAAEPEAAALPFELCLAVLEAPLAGGEELPPAGNALPPMPEAAPDEDAALPDATAALALPAFIQVVPQAPTPLATDPATAADGVSTVAVPSARVFPFERPLAERSSGAMPGPSADTGPNVAVATDAVSTSRAAPPAPGVGSTAPPGPQIEDALAAVAPAPLVKPPAGADATAATPATPAATPPANTVPGTDTVDAPPVAESAAPVQRGERFVGRRAVDPREVVRVSRRDGMGTDASAISGPSGASEATASVAAPAVGTAASSAPPAATRSMSPVAENVTAIEPQSSASAPTPSHALGPHTATTSHAAAQAPAVPDRPPVDTTTPRWHEAFANRVQWLAEQNIGEAHIRLNPPELGAVDVKISVVDDKAFVHLTTHTAAARDELAQSLPRLRDLLATGGLELGGASVETGRDGHARYERGPSDQPYEPRGSASSAEALPQLGPTRRAIGGGGRIDLFA